MLLWPSWSRQRSEKPTIQVRLLGVALGRQYAEEARTKIPWPGWCGADAQTICPYPNASTTSTASRAMQDTRGENVFGKLRQERATCVINPRRTGTRLNRIAPRVRSGKPGTVAGPHHRSVAKRPKAAVLHTAIRGFKSLHSYNDGNAATHGGSPLGYAALPLMQRRRLGLSRTPPSSLPGRELGGR